MKNLLLIIFFVLSTCLFSTVINIPADQPTIQEGINVAVNGDTVLVQPGTYVENINYNGNSIAIGSLFLTTQDTTYISQTVIDGGQPLNPECASVVTFENGENSSAILSGFTIRNGSGTYADPSGSGYYHYIGGGIYCINSNPNLTNLKINNNVVESGGAGIYFYNSDVSMNNSVISNNSANWQGGGVYCIENSNLNILNTKIINNISGSYGGGIFFHSESNSQLEDVVISGNTAENPGGGICSFSSNMNLENTTISNNISGSRGGGIYTYAAEIYLSGVNISNNSAESKGGGISGSIMIFDSENKSNIYSNSAQFGNDLYNGSGNTVNVIVDTFTVMVPTNYHAHPINQFTFDILHGIEPQVNADLYVSPDGDNTNSGLSFDDPLRNIYYALSIISANSENPRTIYLNAGTYSPETNEESFPILCTSWVSILGMDEDTTILDADMQESVIYCSGVDGVSIEDVTLTNGVAYWSGGGIYCANSELDIFQVTISNCLAGEGGGIHQTNSNSIFSNISVINNAAKHCGGIYSYESTLSIIDSDILSNHADETAGGICCNVGETLITSTNIIGNNAGGGGGGLACGNSNPVLLDVLISENTAHYGGGMTFWNSNPNLGNVTIANNNATYRGGGIGCFYEGSSINLTNVTISENVSLNGFGGGIYSEFGSNIHLENCIMWNDIPNEIVILNGSFVSTNYCDIEGGAMGTGNIDDDPLFSDDEFHLSESSPCIDAGNPDSLYYDIEDPYNPGYALYPAMGTILNDMGAYGGHGYYEPPVSADEELITVKSVIKLNNYPNPFNPTTTIQFSNEQNEQNKAIRIEIYNIKGQKVETLECNIRDVAKTTRSFHSITWNAKNHASGIYLYKLNIKDSPIKKMLLMK